MRPLPPRNLEPGVRLFQRFATGPWQTLWQSDSFFGSSAVVFLLAASGMVALAWSGENYFVVTLGALGIVAVCLAWFMKILETNAAIDQGVRLAIGRAMLSTEEVSTYQSSYTKYHVEISGVKFTIDSNLYTLISDGMILKAEYYAYGALPKFRFGPHMLSLYTSDRYELHRTGSL